MNQRRTERSPRPADPPGAPSGGGSSPADGVLVFASDGRLFAATADRDAAIDRSIRTAADLEQRYRQSDGLPVRLGARARQVGVPVSGGGRRVLLISEPLTPADAAARSDRPLPDAALAVTVIPLGEEDDPLTLQRALASVLAHEMRTPMTTIYAGAELLSRPALPEGARMEAASTVALAAEQLHAVIEDLVLLVRWSSDRLTDTGPVLVGPIVRRAAARRRAASVSVEVRVPPEVPPVVGTDEAVDHLVRNLVDHAVANAGREGRVAIEASTDGEWLRLRVTDDGPALSHDELERAFDLFSPTSRDAGDPSGANLSMVVARRLAERLRGTIQALPGGGGIVEVALPVAS